MKNVGATNGQRVSLASFFLKEEKVCAGNLVVAGTLLNFCGVLLGRPPLLRTIPGQALNRRIQSSSRSARKICTRIKKYFSQGSVTSSPRRGVYCGANQNTRRRKRNAPIYSAETD